MTPVKVELRDGSAALIRPIEPGDWNTLRTAFEHLSEHSRYQRFLTPMPRLSNAMVDYLTEVDHHGHEALIALDAASGDGVGVARYVREPGTECAEAAVTVADEWQGRGLGTVLLEMLGDRGRKEGVTRFTALLLAENREMLDLLESLGPVRVVDTHTGTLEVAADLPEKGVGPELKQGLRMAARESVRLVHPLGARGPRD